MSSSGRGSRAAAPLGWVVGAGALAAVLLAGCGGSDSGTAKPETAASTASSGTVAAAGPAVIVRQFQFMPAELTVKARTQVTWTNEDDILHTATSGTAGRPDGKFDGPMDGRAKSFSHAFDQPGRYPYFCSRHESMTGTVVVE